MNVNRMVAGPCALMCALAGLFAVGVDNASAKGSATSRAAKVEKQIDLLEKREWKHATAIGFFTKNPKRRWMLHLRYSHLPCWKVPLKGPEKLCAVSRGVVRVNSKRLTVVRNRIDRLEDRLFWLQGPSWCKRETGNRALGCILAYKVWPSEYEWNALEALWDDESGWSEYADNPTSDACGIPQAMNNCAYGYNPIRQIKWGIRYILGRSDYGRPSRARALFLSRSPHWY